ncbi:MAG: hypothetical protein M3Q31_12455 [Actinomycetota bacterium]|nr:hypothetical protein [Actinomycetota bacterium]
MSLIYIEYISRRPGVALEAFHAVAGGGQEGWAGDYDADVAVLNLGRTWRMGPEPEYLTAWYSPSAGLERLDEWERIFKSGDAARFEEPFRLAARIDRAGVYEPLLEPVVGSAGRYYAEFFDVAPGVTRDEVRAAYEARAGRHSQLELNLLCDRVGALGPDPRGLAFWGAPSYAALDGIARELDGAERPIRLVTAALYNDFGAETL